MSTEETPMERRWPTIRAVLVTLAIGVSLLEGCPTPRASRANLETPVNRAELERWTDILGGLGVEMSASELGDAVIEASERTNTAHAKVLAPVRPLFAALRITQRWSLFPIADTHPVWMHVEARCGGTGFELVYRPNDDDARFDEEVLEYRRVRATWNPSIRGPRAAHSAFVDWIARRIFRARPECDAVRVRYLEMVLPEPGEAGVTYGRFVWDAVRARSEVSE